MIIGFEYLDPSWWPHEISIYWSILDMDRILSCYIYIYIWNLLARTYIPIYIHQVLPDSTSVEGCMGEDRWNLFLSMIDYDLLGKIWLENSICCGMYKLYMFEFNACMHGVVLLLPKLSIIYMINRRSIQLSTIIMHVGHLCIYVKLISSIRSGVYNSYSSIWWARSASTTTSRIWRLMF